MRYRFTPFTRLVCMLGALMVLADCAPSTRYTPASARLADPVVSMPMRLVYDLPVIDVLINGRGPFAFIIDTGSDTCLMTRELADTLNLPHNTAANSTGFAQTATTRASADVRRVQAIDLGDARLGPIDVAAVPAERLFAPYLGKHVQGLLGRAMFARSVLTLDYPGHRLLLGDQPLPPPDGEHILPFCEGQGITIDVTAGATPLIVSIDSGFNGPLDISAASAAKLAPLAGPNLNAPDAAAIGFANAQARRLDVPLKIGAFTIEAPISYVHPEAGAAIGTRILRFFSISIDQPNGVVGFAHTGGPIIMRPIRTLGMSWTLGADGMHIRYVQPGTLAWQSGVRAGDVLQRINGADVDYVLADSDGWRKLEDAAQPLDLTLLRDGKLLEAKAGWVTVLP